MNYNDIEPNLVRVNQGSGVLVPALTNEFCYVFTAKHNLVANENVIKGRAGNELARAASQNCYVDQERDAAVIILHGVDCPPLSLDCQSLGRMQKVTLGGYPSTRQNEVGERATRFFDGEIKRAEESDFNIFCEEFPTQDDIMGLSGGGIFADFGSEWVLVGIEHCVDGAEPENNSQVKSCRTRVFEAIINDNALPAPLPVFLKSFENLLDVSFLLNGTFFNANKKQALSALLRSYAKSKIENSIISPELLRNALGIELLVKNTPEFSVNSRKLWVSWLELMALSLLIDDKDAADLNMDYIDELRKRRRLLYSNSKDDWSKLVKDIVATEWDGIEDGSIVIVSNDCVAPPTRAVVDFSALAVDIGIVGSEMFDFTKASRPAPSRLLHLDGIHVMCVNNKEDEYDCKNALNTIQKIKNEYSATIT